MRRSTLIVRAVATAAAIAALTAATVTTSVTRASAATSWRNPVSSTSPAAIPQTERQCAKVLFIGARGSAEHDRGVGTATFGATVQAARTFIKQGMDSTGSNVDVRQVWVDYPAHDVIVLVADILNGKDTAAKGSDYFQGAQKGYKSAAAVLEGSLKHCPNEKWIAAGYSQGAIITDTLARAYDVPNRWIGIYSVANTANFPARHVRTFGTAFENQKPTGVYTWLYKSQVDLPTDLQSRSMTYCAKYDGLCDFSLLKLKAAHKDGFGIHGGYASGTLLRASAFSLGQSAANRLPVATRKAFDPQSIPIPPMCQHGASRLTHGSVDFGMGRGGAELLPKPGSTSISTPFYATQQDPYAIATGVAAAVPIWCTAGGVSWPETIAIYTLDGRLLAYKNLGDLAHQEHASVTAISLNGNVIKVRWDAYDGANFDIHHQSATFTRSGGKLIVTSFKTGK